MATGLIQATVISPGQPQESQLCPSAPLLMSSCAHCICTQQPENPLYFILFFFIFLGPHLQHVEVPRLGVESELQLLAYTTATVMPDPPDPSCVCDLHPSSYSNAGSLTH